MNLLGRENEILRILTKLSNSGVKFILVGGYAVSAHSKHRFSIDCDLIVEAKDVPTLKTLLLKEDFSKGVENDSFDETYGGKFIRYNKKVGKLPVSVDLLVDALACRQTGGSWSYGYVLSNSVDAKVSGITSSVESKIPKRELLMAFKLHAARKPDVRDVVMLGEEADWSEVFPYLNRGDPEKLQISLKQFVQSLDDTKLIDSLKGEFKLQGNVTPSLQKAKRQVQKILDQLSETVKDIRNVRKVD